jgi:hypothetical protein
MDAQSKKHGRKSGGHGRGGKDIKRAGKGQKATKRGGSGKAGGLTLLERERRALAEAAPLGRASVSPPAPPSPPEIAPRPASFVLRGGTLAILAFVAVAVCGLALLRACERQGTPIEDDAAETSSCSDDGSLCVAAA